MRIDPPSREAMEGKLRIYADDADIVAVESGLGGPSGLSGQ